LPTHAPDSLPYAPDSPNHQWLTLGQGQQSFELQSSGWTGDWSGHWTGNCSGVFQTSNDDDFF
jgi:hypothetical protein